MRKLVFISIVLLVAVGLVWSGLWFYAAREAAEQLDQVRAAEAKEGRLWSCGHRAFSGFPFGLTLDCDKPRFEGRAPDQTVAIDAQRLSVAASLLDPHKLIAHLTGPLFYKTSDGQVAAKFDWSSALIQADGVPAPRGLRLVIDDLTYTGTFGAAGTQAGLSRSVAAQLAWPDAHASAQTAFAVTLQGAPIAALDQWLGSNAPTEADVTGSFDAVDVSAARTPEEALDIWRQAGGRLTLAASHISHATSRLSGTGTLSLDAAHRPQGQIDASFVGLDPVLKRYGINANLAAAGSLLTSLFGGARAAPAPPVATEPGALTLPIVFKNGHLGIGPIATDVEVPPLY
jgi:hypothetical protein